MKSFTTQDIERVLRLSRSTIRGLVDAGFVRPKLGPRRSHQFSFQDLIVLRAARSLIESNVPRRRINRALSDLRKHLPAEVPLSGLNISAVGDRIVVREGAQQFQVEDGQYVLGLDVKVDGGGVLRVIERKAAPVADPGADEDWFATGLALESTDASAALAAYERAVALDAENAGAWTNWGRLLHELGRIDEASAVYQRAQAHCAADAVLLFNFGVLLEDSGNVDAALDAYRSALTSDPDFADCHYNVARLYELAHQPQHALRHYSRYRRLVATHARPE
jgi:tetratricopeptide (TPR) repeat protein